MSQRTEELVKRFEAANNTLIRCIEGCSEEELNMTTSGEGWSVRVAAHHLGVTYEPVIGLAQIIATGTEWPPLTMDMIHQMNAQHATDHANVSKAAVLESLRDGGAKASDVVAGFSDEQLDRSANAATFGGPVSTQQVIENVLIGHVDHHLGSIKAAIGQ